MVLDGKSAQLAQNVDIKEFYLGLTQVGERKSYRDVKHYKRRKRWIGVGSDRDADETDWTDNNGFFFFREDLFFNPFDSSDLCSIFVSSNVESGGIMGRLSCPRPCQLTHPLRIGHVSLCSLAAVFARPSPFAQYARTPRKHG